MRLRVLWVAVLIPAAAAAVGFYFNGGLAAYGDLEVRVEWGPLVITQHERLGNSYYVGGGVVVPVWRYGATNVTPRLEATADIGHSSKTKQVEYEQAQDYELAWTTIPIRGGLLFGVEAGPARPYGGFGVGLAVVPWTVTHTPTGAEVDNQTETQATFAIPFGCDFRLTPAVAVGFRAEYLIVTGEVSPEIEVENVGIAMPNPFLVTGTVRLDL
ncbi:MAG: outer membrane beta-barrel protein [Candidatus Coatesbacteria bacterium]|nr:MAG: outer membrane beta-barrel protein [Candidatus Coatesbacteria bacterium]